MKTLSLNLIKESLSGIDELLAEFRTAVNCMTVLFAPDLQEIVSEELELALKFGIVLSHACDVLLKCVNVTLGLLC